MKYYTKQDIENLIPKKLHEEFEKEMIGQACPIVDDEYCYYKHDVDRFLRSNNLEEGEGREL